MKVIRSRTRPVSLGACCDGSMRDRESCFLGRALRCCRKFSVSSHCTLIVMANQLVDEDSIAEQAQRSLGSDGFCAMLRCSRKLGGT